MAKSAPKKDEKPIQAPQKPTSPTRKEVDLLGEMEVSNEHYYGIHTLRAMDNFHISGKTINDVPDFIRGMVQVKKAAALANRRLHTLPAKKCDAIVWACDQILHHGRCMDQFPIDVFQGGAGTSLNMNTNEVIANLALEHLGEPKGAYDIINPNDDVNMSQSTNDAYPTGFRLGVYACMQRLIERIDDLQHAFHRKADEFVDILKMGRTQLQDAVPMTLGDEFNAFAHNLAEEQAILRDAADRLLEINLGATAIGTGLNTPAGYRHPGRSHRPAHQIRRRPHRGHQRHRRLRARPLSGETCRHETLKNLQRPAAPSIRADRRPARNQPSRTTSRILHHAGQSQPGHPRSRQPSMLQSLRQ